MESIGFGEIFDERGHRKGKVRLDERFSAWETVWLMVPQKQGTHTEGQTLVKV